MTAVAFDPNYCDPNDIRERMVSWMEAHKGFKETLGKNDGPELRVWRALLNIDYPIEWCANTVFAAAHYSALDLNVQNPCPKTASVLHLWSMAKPEQHMVVPARGRIFILDHGGGKGHAGIISKVNPDGSLEWYSGNTNAAGSRTGDSLLWKSGDLEKVHHGKVVGFVDLSVGLVIPPPAPLVA